MREFKTICVDNKTRMQMVLSECSFNMAVSYLEEKKLGKYLGLEKTDIGYKLIFEDVVFFYDSDRGYLLKGEKL